MKIQLSPVDTKTAVVLCLSLCTILATSPAVDAFPNFREIFEQIKDHVNSMVDNMNLNTELSNLVSDVKNFTRNLGDIATCYMSEVEGRPVNIFDGNLNFKALVNYYYEAFPHNNISDINIQNLLNSTKQIIKRCIQNPNSTSQYGFTELSDKSDEDVQRMLGIRLDMLDETESDNRTKRLSGSDSRCIATGSVPESFDWRDYGVVTPVKNQGSCGSCWTFASLASIESAYLIKGKTANTEFDLSEQEMINCVSHNGCRGGTSYMAFSYVDDNGITYDSNMPYRARNGNCPAHSLPTAARIQNFCVRSKFRYTSDFKTEKLTDKDLQQSLVRFGPLYVGVDSSPLITKNYRSGILDEPTCSTQINHAVLLVGYTKDAWIIKNSWGRRWGEDGYFRLARNRNMCGVNTELAFALLD